MADPVARFVDDIGRLGLNPRIEAGLVLFTVEPVDGARAGGRVETGVDATELARWPQVPPHWVHFPTDVKLARTNSRPSSRKGWTKHSRQIVGWGFEQAGVAWAGHVRGILSEAVS